MPEYNDSQDLTNETDDPTPTQPLDAPARARLEEFLSVDELLTLWREIDAQ